MTIRVLSEACAKGECQECGDPGGCLDGCHRPAPLSDLDDAYRLMWDPDWGNEPDETRDQRAVLDPYQYDV